MKRLARAASLVRHLYLVWRAGQLRFRLETFGVYYPALPYTLPLWRAPWRNVVLLLRQSRGYARWVIEMEALRCSGSSAWWNAHLPNRRDRLDDW